MKMEHIMRRWIALLLVCVMFLTAGCSSLFEKEYTSTRVYEDPDTTADADTTEIHNYSMLRRALNAMVASYRTSQVLIFADYDGIISDDLSKACWELRSNTALGAWCVRDIEYTTEQVVAYVEADITVSYKRSEQEVESLRNAQTRSALVECVADALESQTKTVAVQMNTAALSESDVAELALQTALDHPLLCVEVPEVNVTLYSGATNQKIFEITMLTRLSEAETLSRREKLEAAAKTVIAELDADDPAAPLQAAVSVARRVTPAGEGGTAYDALVNGASDSQGLAMAVQAVWLLMDAEGAVVSGQLDSAAHTWNLLKLGDNYYHLDLAGYAGTVWLQPDRDIWGRYWWSTDLYPACAAQGFSWQEGQALTLPQTP